MDPRTLLLAVVMAAIGAEIGFLDQTLSAIAANTAKIAAEDAPQPIPAGTTIPPDAPPAPQQQSDQE
jgi:hypothetical protein